MGKAWIIGFWALVIAGVELAALTSFFKYMEWKSLEAAIHSAGGWIVVFGVLFGITYLFLSALDASLSSRQR